MRVRETKIQSQIPPHSILSTSLKSIYTTTLDPIPLQHGRLGGKIGENRIACSMVHSSIIPSPLSRIVFLFIGKEFHPLNGTQLAWPCRRRSFGSQRGRIIVPHYNSSLTLPVASATMLLTLLAISSTPL